MSGELFDDRYVGFREHAAAMQRTDAELARIRERQATTEATLLHEVAAVRADVSEMKQLMLRPAPVDHGALSNHHVADALERLATTRGSNGQSLLLTIMAMIGSLAAGAFVMGLFKGF